MKIEKDFNYNLNDENTKYYYMGKVLTNKPIKFYGMNIRYITVDEVFNKGEKWLNEMLFPFMRNRDTYLDSIPNDNIGLLEIFYYITETQLKNGETIDTYMDLLKDGISYFFGIDEKRIDFFIERNTGLINLVILDEYNPRGKAPQLIINSDRFEELRKIILLICGDIQEIHRSDLNKEDLESKIKSKSTKKRLGRLLEEEKKRESNMTKTSRIYNVYNSVVSMTDLVNYDRILDLNIYQLYNSYNNAQIKEDNNFLLNTASNGLCSEGTKIVPFINRIQK